MIFTEIKELIKLFSDYELTELSISDNETKFELKKTINHMQPSEIIAIPKTIKSNELDVDEGQELPNKGYKEVKAPLVGVFYEAPSEGAEPYVKEGSYVKKGDVLCLIEAMKMMSEIKSPFNGYIRKVNIKNENLVEFNSILFLVEESQNV